MKTLIIYKSITGFTKEYVDLIKRRIVDAQVVELKKLKKKMIKESDVIFFGAPLRNNKIVGLNKFLKYNNLFDDKEIFIFATGISPIDPDKKQNVIDMNGLEFYHVRLYLLPGGFDMKRMSKFKQKIFTFALNSVAKSKKAPAGMTPETAKLILERQLDMVSADNIERMMEVYYLISMKRRSQQN